MIIPWHLYFPRVDSSSVLDLIRLFRCSNLVLPGSIRLNMHVLLSVKEQLGMDLAVKVIQLTQTPSQAPSGRRMTVSREPVDELSQQLHGLGSV